jgi:RND family efflux transporter MFP subunit
LKQQLDQKDVKLAYDQALADVQSAKVQYDAAASNFQRTKQLYETSNASLSDYEQAKTSYSNAESSYEISLKRLDLQKSQIEYTEIIAPMSGIISNVNVELNEVVKSGSTIIVMSSEKNNDIEALVGLPEKYINEVKSGDQVSVRVSSIDQNFKGSITEVGYSSSKTGVTFPVIVSIESSGNNQLRPDMPAQVTFQFGSADQSPTIIAPLKAVASGVEGNYVYKLTPKDDAYIASRAKVELGDITKNGYTVKSGLNEGDLVAVAGLSSLYEGRVVKLLEN